MSDHLKKITTRAKSIRRLHPNKVWTDCIKQASRELKSGSKKKVGTTVKKSKPVKSAAKKVMPTGNLRSMRNSIENAIESEKKKINSGNYTTAEKKNIRSNISELKKSLTIHNKLLRKNLL